MNAWVVVLAVGAASLVIRALPLLATAVVPIGPRVQQGLRHAGMGAMAALLVGALAPQGSSSWHPDPAVLVALSVGAVLAWRRASLIRVLAGGGAAYVAIVGLMAVA